LDSSGDSSDSSGLYSSSSCFDSTSKTDMFSYSLTSVQEIKPQIPDNKSSKAVKEQNEDEVTLVIAHTNDIHGYLTSFYDKDFYNGFMVGGLPYIASIVDDIRKRHPGQVMLVDAGDNLQGGTVNDCYQGAPTSEIMNYMKYNARGIGNHDFCALETMLAASTCPFFVANVVYENDPGRIIYDLKPYKIEEINGVKVGTLFLTTDDTPNATLPEYVKGMKFLNPIETAKKYVPLMKKMVQN
jgi:2',3'-cyclic-nucleotide 2'-phosphodiesterase (5'-nucleotidase family)